MNETPKIFRSADEGVQIILQVLDGVGWYLAHGGDFFIREANGEWLPKDHIGFGRWLKAKGLGRFSIGAEHEVLFDGEWILVDRYGLYAYAETLPDVMLGSMISDLEWNEIMGEAIAEKRLMESLGRMSDDA